METYASHRAVAQCFGLGLCSRFGTLPPTMTPCPHSGIILEEASGRPATFGKIPNIVGTLPKVPHLTLIGYNWPHTCHQDWTRKGTSSWTFALDLWPLSLGHKKISPSRLRPFFMPDMEAIGQKVLFCGKFRVCDNVLITDTSEKAVNKHSFLKTCTMYRCQCKQ